MMRYLAALIVGRLPRFYFYAVVGHAIDVPVWLLVLTFFVMIGITLVGSRRGREDD